MKQLIKQKTRAFAIHLAFSLLVVSAFLLYAFLVWYPEPYFEVAGLDRIVIVLVAVDLVLGPILTFILYRKNKPHLKLDLSIVALLQLAAFMYGAHAIYIGHPAYVAFAVDRFELIPVMDVDPKRAKYKKFRVSTLWKPMVVFAQIPKEREEHNKLLFEVVMQNKPGVERRPEYYESIEEHLDEMMKRALNTDDLFSTKEAARQLSIFMSDKKGTLKDYAFFPLVGKSKDMIVAVRRDTGKMAGTLPIDPWEKH